MLMLMPIPMLIRRDNIFATYMTSLSSKEIAYSNFIQGALFLATHRLYT